MRRGNNAIWGESGTRMCPNRGKPRFNFRHQHAWRANSCPWYAICYIDGREPKHRSTLRFHYRGITMHSSYSLTTVPAGASERSHGARHARRQQFSCFAARAAASALCEIPSRRSGETDEIARPCEETKSCTWIQNQQSSSLPCLARRVIYRPGFRHRSRRCA